MAEQWNEEKWMDETLRGIEAFGKAAEQCGTKSDRPWTNY